MSACATCGGKGYVPDETFKSMNGGLPCPDCIDPVVARFIESGEQRRKPYLAPHTQWTRGLRGTKGRAFHTPPPRGR